MAHATPRARGRANQENAINWPAAFRPRPQQVAKASRLPGSTARGARRRAGSPPGGLTWTGCRSRLPADPRGLGSLTRTFLPFRHDRCMVDAPARMQIEAFLRNDELAGRCCWVWRVRRTWRRWGRQESPSDGDGTIRRPRLRCPGDGPGSPNKDDLTVEGGGTLGDERQPRHLHRADCHCGHHRPGESHSVADSTKSATQSTRSTPHRHWWPGRPTVVLAAVAPRPTRESRPLGNSSDEQGIKTEFIVGQVRPLRNSSDLSASPAP